MSTVIHAPRDPSPWERVSEVSLSHEHGYDDTLDRDIELAAARWAAEVDAEYLREQPRAVELAAERDATDRRTRQATGLTNQDTRQNSERDKWVRRTRSQLGI